jgi:hypothetical protein
MVAVLACLSLQATTSSWHPTWIDDVMQMEPAVNWTLGRGFVTFAQASQSGQIVYATNNSLYAFLLSPWISMLGIDYVPVRVFDLLLCAGAIWLAVTACLRMGVLRTSAACWATLAIALYLDSVSFIYRSGRADSATMLACALIVFAYARVRTKSATRAWLFASSVLVVPAGIHAIPFVAALIVIARLLDPMFRWSYAALVVSGSAAGMAALLAYYYFEGVHIIFLQSTFGSGANLLGALAQCVLIWDVKSVMRLADVFQELAPVKVLTACLRDESARFLLAGLAAAALFGSRASGVRELAYRGLLVAVLIPLAMLLAGRYVGYYTWMATIPIAIAFVGTAERAIATLPGRFTVGAVAVLSVASMMQGFPLRVADDLQRFGPTGRGNIEQLCREQLRDDDVVFGARAIYFPVKQRNLGYIAISYSGGRGYPEMSDSERGSVTVVIVPEGEVEEAMSKVKGEWAEVARYPVHIDMTSADSKPKDFVVFRRRDVP